MGLYCRKTTPEVNNASPRSVYLPMVLLSSSISAAYDVSVLSYGVADSGYGSPVAVLIRSRLEQRSLELVDFSKKESEWTMW